MTTNQMEHLIKADLNTLSEIKMAPVSAVRFYGTLLSRALVLSAVLLGLNTGIQLLLSLTGLNPIKMSMSLIVTMWGVGFFLSLFLSLFISRFVLISKILRGRIGVEKVLTQTLKRFFWIGLCIYSVCYAFLTLLIVSGMDEHVNEPWLIFFIILFTQAGALITALGINGLLLGVELDRLGMGAVFNVASDLIRKKGNADTRDATKQDGQA